MSTQRNWSVFLGALCVVFAVAHAQRQAQCCEEYCYELDSERPQSGHFSTKTAYQIAKGSDFGRQYYVPSKSSFRIITIGLCLTVEFVSFNRLQSN